MQLAIILAIIAANALSLNGPQVPAETAVVKVIFCAAICFGSVVAVRYVAAPQKTRTKRDRYHSVLLLALVALTYGLLDYSRIVRFNWHLEHFVLVDDLVLLAPIVAFLILSWATLSERSRDQHGGSGSWLSDATRRLRIAIGVARHQLLPAVVPVLAVLAVTDTMRLIDSPQARIVEAILIGVVLASLVILTPWLLKMCWRTRSLPNGDRRQQIEQMLKRANLRIGDILIWKTDRRVINAMVAGLLPICRYVFVSDGLVERLDDDRLSAVVAHEAGHVRHRHLFRLLLSLQIPLFSLLIVQQMLDRVEMDSDSIQIYGLFSVMLGWIVIHARIARSLEHQADVAACHILANSPRLEPQAVARYGDALRSAVGDSPTNDWLHPSLAKRLALLRYLSRHASHEAEFETRIRRLNWLLLIAVAALATAWLVLV